MTPFTDPIHIKISMDGKGRWMDNVFVERLWRSVKYEEIYLFEYSTMCDLRAGLKKWFTRYNDWRPQQSHANQTPATIYQNTTIPPEIAA
jgi:putative transposase